MATITHAIGAALESVGLRRPAKRLWDGGSCVGFRPAMIQARYVPKLGTTVRTLQIADKEMVDVSGETSNQLFRELADWEDILRDTSLSRRHRSPSI